MQEALHEVGQPTHLFLHDAELAQKRLAIVRLLRRIAGTQLVEREADEIQRILYFMREAAGQLPQGREALEPVQFLLALASVAELPDHVVEAARQQSNLVASMRLRHRL